MGLYIRLKEWGAPSCSFLLSPSLPHSIFKRESVRRLKNKHTPKNAKSNWERMIQKLKKWNPQGVAAVGFEPTPSKWLEPKSSALDHSATLPPACSVFHTYYISLMTRRLALYKPCLPPLFCLPDISPASLAPVSTYWPRGFLPGFGNGVLSLSAVVNTVGPQH